MKKKRILCFGDSNTWGYNPRTAERFDEDTRWTAILQKELGEEYLIIEEGQNGRTIAVDDPSEGEKNGIKHIIPCMESQKPFDLLIIMLGTNDLKEKFGFCARDIAGEMHLMLEKIISYKTWHMKEDPKILLIAPPCIGENIEESWLGEGFGNKRAIRISKEIPDWYEMLSKRFSCLFLDVSKDVFVGETDAIHLEEKGHQQLADLLKKYIQNIF